jgi:hypothetical protein
MTRAQCLINDGRFRIASLVMQWSGTLSSLSLFLYLIVILIKVKKRGEDPESEEDSTSDVIGYNNKLKSKLIKLFGNDSFLTTTMRDLLPTKSAEVSKIKSIFKNKLLI